MNLMRKPKLVILAKKISVLTNEAESSAGFKNRVESQVES